MAQRIEVVIVEVIIPPDQFDLWLDPAVHDEMVLSGMLQPYMTAYPISTKVSNPRNDVAACIEPVEEKRFISRTPQL